jgi:two-component system response regulator NreC
MNTIRILVVDDHTLVRDGITSLLSEVSNLQVVGLAKNGDEAITMLESTNPDIVLMDIIMPKLNGIEVTEILIKKYPQINIILLSMEISEEFVLKGIKAGAKGYLPKDIRKKTLIEAIITVHQGGTYFSQKVSNLMLSCLASDKKSEAGNTAKDIPLSCRELEVLIHIATGFSNREIGEQLFISVKTVDTHRINILRKINVRSTAELVKYALKNGIISLE